MHVNAVDLAAAVIGSLYGLRLFASSELVQVATRWPEPFFQYVDAFVTYTILIPATLFVQSLIGPGRHALLRRTWQLLAICAVVAILADLIARQPHAAIRLNTPLVVLTAVPDSDLVRIS